MNAKEYSKARNMASTCIELAPDNAECYLIMGLCYAAESKMTSAGPHYRRFLELAPAHPLAPKIKESLRRAGERY